MSVLKFAIFMCCSLIGMGAFVTFLVLQNYPAAVWAIIAGNFFINFFVDNFK